MSRFPIALHNLPVAYGLVKQTVVLPVEQSKMALIFFRKWEWLEMVWRGGDKKSAQVTPVEPARQVSLVNRLDFGVDSSLAIPTATQPSYDSLAPPRIAYSGV